MASHLHFGAAVVSRNDTEVAVQGKEVDFAAEELENKRAAFNAARAQFTAEVNQKRTIQLPTQDFAVKKKLREYGEPITLFGEGAMERRERLRVIMTSEGKEGSARQAQMLQMDNQEPRDTFFTPGPEGLLEWRQKIAKHSLVAASNRLEVERGLNNDLHEIAQEEEQNSHMIWIERSMDTELSQVGDDRPLTQGKFSPDGKIFATAGWSGQIKLWSVPDGKVIKTYRADNTMCHGVAFAPSKSSSGNYHIAGGMADGTIKVFGGDSLVEIKGHDKRVNRIAYHPMGPELLMSTSHDQTWRMWDVNTQQNVLLQEGHSSGTYGLAVHPDGSLICTGDLGGVCRLWDIRTGRTVLPLEGHYDQILGIDFNRFGFQVATASADRTIRMWDLRKRKCVDIVHAHSKTISEVNFDKSGKFFVSSSFDGQSKIWNAWDNTCVKCLVGHESRVMGAHVSPQQIGGQYYVGTVAFDRTFKFWATRGKMGDW